MKRSAEALTGPIRLALTVVDCSPLSAAGSHMRKNVDKCKLTSGRSINYTFVRQFSTGPACQDTVVNFFGVLDSPRGTGPA